MAPDPVADRTGDVADSVAVAQGRKLNEINGVADVVVPHGKARKPKGRASVDRKESFLTAMHPARLPKPGDLLAVVATGVTLEIACPRRTRSPQLFDRQATLTGCRSSTE
jgi:hypothetical protein